MLLGPSAETSLLSVCFLHRAFLLGNEAGDEGLRQQLGLNGVPTWPGHLGTGLSPLLTGPRIHREVISSAVLAELLDATEPSS